MDILKKDNDWLGVAMGLLTPALAFGVSQLLKMALHYMISTPFLLILCVGANFIPVQYYTKMELNKTARGLVLVTIAMGMIFFYYKLFILKE